MKGYGMPRKTATSGKGTVGVTSSGYGGRRTASGITSATVAGGRSGWPPVNKQPTPINDPRGR